MFCKKAEIIRKYFTERSSYIFLLIQYGTGQKLPSNYKMMNNLRLLRNSADQKEPGSAYWVRDEDSKALHLIP